MIRVPFARDAKLSKYLSSPYTNLPDSTPQLPKLRDRTKKCKNLYLPLTGPDGEEIPPWKEVIYFTYYLFKTVVKFFALYIFLS